MEHRNRTVVIDIQGRGHDTMTLDRVKPSVINAGDPPVPPRAHPRGRPPQRPHSPSPADVAHPPEIHLQAAMDPPPPTPHPPCPLSATTAPPTHVQPHRIAHERLPTMLEPPDDEPLF